MGCEEINGEEEAHEVKEAEKDAVTEGGGNTSVQEHPMGVIRCETIKKNEADAASFPRNAFDMRAVVEVVEASLFMEENVKGNEAAYRGRNPSPTGGALWCFFFFSCEDFLFSFRGVFSLISLSLCSALPLSLPPFL